MYQMPMPYSQYHQAYPTFHHQQPPCASNGYGWHGNGFGWQLDPSAWKQPAAVEGTDVADGPPVVEEPTITVEKLGKQDAAYTRGIPDFGGRGSDISLGGEKQDFYKLRDYHVNSGTLFEDPDFPATDRSLFYSRRPDRYYEWKRPHELVDDPKLFVEGYSRFDVQQGELGDCWLLAAVANLTLYKRLFLQVVPDDQSFDEEYSGIFHFRFWQYGHWVDVVIDDRLPTYRGELVYLHSSENNEFWSALLEKAYAKLYGSYEALKGGSTCEAMEDFTGGVTEMYEMNAHPPNLFKILLKAYERSSLMAASLEPDPNVLEAKTPEGLIRGHAYSITRVKYVDISTPNVSGKIPLLRLRNPWGNENEWNGPWGDGTPEWNYISDSEKEDLGLTFDNDGEFWISYKDFEEHFNRLEICNLNPDSLSDEDLIGGHKKWQISIFEGEWMRGSTAGGCRNFLESFYRNPQFRVTLNEADENDEEGKCTLIVALMQKNRRQKRMHGEDLLTIGFAIYYLHDPDRAPRPLDLNFFKYNVSVARSPTFVNLREVTCRFKLPRGTYCIVPSTFDPDEEGEFLIRIFSEHQNNVEYDNPAYNNLSRHRRDDNPTPRYSDHPDYPPASHFQPSPSPFSFNINDFFTFNSNPSYTPGQEQGSHQPYPSNAQLPSYPTHGATPGANPPYPVGGNSQVPHFSSGGAPGYPGGASGYPGSAPGYPNNAPGYPGSAPAGYPGSAPAGYPGSAPAGYPGGAPVYPGGTPGYPGNYSGGGYPQAPQQFPPYNNASYGSYQAPQQPSRSPNRDGPVTSFFKEFFGNKS